MPNGLRPDIIVEQVFDTPQPTVPATILPVCLIGLNRQLEWQKVAGTFTGGQPGQQYLFPSLVPGAVVEDSSAVLDVPEFPDVLKPHVYIQNEHGLTAMSHLTCVNSTKAAFPRFLPSSSK